MSSEVQANQNETMDALKTENKESAATKCIRRDCNNVGVDDEQLQKEYCSEECLVAHCKDVFAAWVKAQSSSNQSNTNT